jgi:hypothetical protein
MEQISYIPPETEAKNVPKTPSAKPRRQPSPEAVEMLVKMIVAKGIREGKLNPLPDEAQIQIAAEQPMKKHSLYFGSTMEEISKEINAGLVKSSGNSIPIICTRRPPDLTVEDGKIGLLEKVFNFLFNDGRRKTILDKRWE